MDELSKIILACALLVLLILAIIALAVWYSMRARDRGLEPEVEQENLEQNKFAMRTLIRQNNMADVQVFAFDRKSGM